MTSSNDIAPVGGEAVRQQWPNDGPHSHQDTVGAAGTIEQLARYLCHATQRRAGTPYPSTVRQVLVELSLTASHLDQLLRQLAGRVEILDSEPVIDDRGQNPADTIAVTGGALFAALEPARVLAERLELAATHVGHLRVRN